MMNSRESEPGQGEDRAMSPVTHSLCLVGRRPVIGGSGRTLSLKSHTVSHWVTLRDHLLSRHLLLLS